MSLAEPNRVLPMDAILDDGGIDGQDSVAVFGFDAGTKSYPLVMDGDLLWNRKNLLEEFCLEKRHATCDVRESCEDCF